MPPRQTERRLRTVEVLGVRVHDVTYKEAIDCILWHIATRVPAIVVTPNTEFVMQAQRDPDFRNVLNSAALAIPDGIGLVLGSRLLGNRIRDHVRGTDLVEKLAAIAAVEGHRFFLLGAGEGVADLAARRLKARYPGLQVAGVYAGSPDVSQDNATRAAIRAAGKIDVLLVAYGARKQEQWMARNQATLGIPVAIGVGGALDFFSGRAKRAPRWIRRLELEWLYRLLRQPSRWRRQLALPQFAFLVLLAWLRAKLPGVARFPRQT